MIRLDLLEPCENCPDLYPIKTGEFTTRCGYDEEHHCTITCENINRCKSILEYLTKEVNKNGN